MATAAQDTAARRRPFRLYLRSVLTGWKGMGTFRTAESAECAGRDALGEFVDGWRVYNDAQILLREGPLAEDGA